MSQDEARKLQESLKHLAEDVMTAERAQSKAQAELASTQRMLRCGDSYGTCIVLYDEIF